MNLVETYTYLRRARQTLWATLEAVPDDVLAAPMLPGDRFYCIKDLLLHIAAVHDGWLHEDILRVPPVLDTWPELAQPTGGLEYAAVPLATVGAYTQAVDARMVAYLATLTEAERTRVVVVHDAPDEHYTVDGLLWHVVLHEVRHTAQICLLLRLQGIVPPALDLLFFLPRA